MAQVRSTQAIKSQGKKRGSVTYSTDQENKASEIFYYICIVCLKGLGMTSIHEGRLQITEEGQKQNESLWNRFYKVFGML